MMPAEPVILVDGGLEDLNELMTVMEDSFDPAYGEAWTAPQCIGLLPMPGVWLTLARIGNEAVGFALARIVLREAELLLLAVEKDVRHRGIGGLLLDRFRLIAETRGASRLHLEVREGNQAVNLYDCAGYVEVGRRKDYYRGRDGQLFDALTLALDTGV